MDKRANLIPKIYAPERQNYTITQYNEQIKQGGFTAADEEPIPYTPVENPFDLNRFKIAVLEIFQEVARANQAPAYVSLAFMNAIIDTYPEKGEWFYEGLHSWKNNG